MKTRMKKRNEKVVRIFFLLAFSILNFHVSLFAQKTRILFVLDASFSMKKNWEGGTKWETAINAMANISDSISKIENVEAGLRVFGHLYDESEHNCKDTRLEIPIAKNGGQRMLAKLKSLKPKGITPIAYSIEKAVSDFGEEPAKNMLILITDGEEACDGEVCAASLLLQQKNIILKPFVIGLQLNKKAEAAFSCIGELVNVNTAVEFETQLGRIVNEAIAKTTIQVNLNDSKGKAVETGMAMTFSDHQTGLTKYHFFHTLNSLERPDTITVSPLFVYDIVVHTIPSIRLENISLKKNTHNIIEADAAQGILHPQVKGPLPKGTTSENMKVVVHLPGQPEILSVLEMNSTEKLLVGNYDVEILTIPLTLLKNVVISAQKNTAIEVPAPGLVQLQKSSEVYGAIFLETKNGLDKIVEIPAGTKLQQWLLQPGKYRIVYRARNSRAIHSSVEKQFEIASGGNVSLKL